MTFRHAFIVLFPSTILPGYFWSSLHMTVTRKIMQLFLLVRQKLFDIMCSLVTFFLGSVSLLIIPYKSFRMANLHNQSKFLSYLSCKILLDTSSLLVEWLIIITVKWQHSLTICHQCHSSWWGRMRFILSCTFLVFFSHISKSFNSFPMCYWDSLLVLNKINKQHKSYSLLF